MYMFSYIFMVTIFQVCRLAKVPRVDCPPDSVGDHVFCVSLFQVVTWLQGPGSELLKTQQMIGDSMRSAQALQQKHEEIESQHSVMKHTHRDQNHVI